MTTSTGDPRLDEFLRLIQGAQQQTSSLVLANAQKMRDVFDLVAQVRQFYDPALAVFGGVPTIMGELGFFLDSLQNAEATLASLLSTFAGEDRDDFIQRHRLIFMEPENPV